MKKYLILVIFTVIFSINCSADDRDQAPIAVVNSDSVNLAIDQPEVDKTPSVSTFDELSPFIKDKEPYEVMKFCSFLYLVSLLFFILIGSHIDDGCLYIFIAIVLFYFALFCGYALFSNLLVYYGFPYDDLSTFGVGVFYIVGFIITLIVPLILNKILVLLRLIKEEKK